MRAWPLLVLTLVAFVQEPAKPDISWNLKPGEKVRYEIEKTIMLHHGKMGAVDMTMKFGLVMEPGAPDAAGLAPVRVTIDRVVVSGKDQKEDEFYDSDRTKEPPKNPGMHLVAACLNGAFDFKLSKTGSMSDFVGLQAVLEKAAEDIPEIKASNPAETSKRFARQIEQFLQEILALAPGKALAKGDTWQAELDAIPFGSGEAPLKIKSTLKQVRLGEAVIGRELTFDFSKDPGAKDCKGTGKGDVTWSLEQGRPISGSWTTHVLTSRGEANVTCVIRLAPREKK